jgi:hypothetical protein
VRLGSDMEMHVKSATSRLPLGSEFDKFLFAPLGEDQNGLPLSVVSLFARMNLDPWQEAENLAALPAEAAARRLALSLDTLMDPVLRHANTEPMVLRLLALLPRSEAAAVHTPVAGVGAAAAPDAGSRIGAIVIITSAIVLLGSQLVAAHRDAPVPPGVAGGAVVPPVSSQTLPPPGH